MAEGLEVVELSSTALSGAQLHTNVELMGSICYSGLFRSSNVEVKKVLYSNDLKQKAI